MHGILSDTKVRSKVNIKCDSQVLIHIVIEAHFFRYLVEQTIFL